LECGEAGDAVTFWGNDDEADITKGTIAVTKGQVKKSADRNRMRAFCPRDQQKAEENQHWPMGQGVASSERGSKIEQRACDKFC